MKDSVKARSARLPAGSGGYCRADADLRAAVSRFCCTGLSSLIFPHQANGSLITVDGITVGAENVGQEFTEDYYMWSRPSAYHYNVYVEDEEGNQTYTDGTEFPGLGSGSNNYAPSNPALIERVEQDVVNYVARTLKVDTSELPGEAELLDAQMTYIAEKANISVDQLKQQAADIPDDSSEVFLPILRKRRACPPKKRIWRLWQVRLLPCISCKRNLSRRRRTHQSKR